jgi:hypothetical protein
MNCKVAFNSSDSMLVQERNCNFIRKGLNGPKFRAEAATVTEPETTFGYAVVEQALMAVHGFVEQKRSAFRGRLIHFQRLKIVPAAPGKGRRIAYRREDIFRWAIALEFAEFGIDPTEIKKILDMNWRRIAHVVLEAKDGRDKYLFFHPNLLGRLSREDEHETSDKPGAPYSVTTAIISNLAELNKQAKTGQAHATLDRYRARYGMINLSRLRRQVEANLIAFSQVRG